MQVDAEDLINSFLKHLSVILDEYELNTYGNVQDPDDLAFKIFKGIEAKSFVAILNEFVQVPGNEQQLMARVSSKLKEENGNQRRVVFAPVSEIFEDTLIHLSAQYRDFVLVDNSRAGEVFAGKTILHPSEVTPQAGDICLMLTRNIHAIKEYTIRWEGYAVFNLLDEFINNYRSTSRGFDQLINDPGLTDYVDKMSEANRPILFFGRRPLSTKLSTVQALQNNGYQCFWYGNTLVDEDNQVTLSMPKIADMGFDDAYIGYFFGILKIASQMKHGAVLFHYQHIWPSNWDYHNAAICYACTLAVIRTVKESRDHASKSKLLLDFYDAIKPATKSYEMAGNCGRVYKTMLKEADGLIISSFTEEIGDFFEGAVQQPLNRVHHHRFQIIEREMRKERLSDGYHIAVVSFVLSERFEPSRSGIDDCLRSALNQGFHVHYYTPDHETPAIQNFIASLTDEAKERFHTHWPIHDQQKLIQEISQYHLGWIFFNMQVFSDQTSQLEDMFMRDAMDIFTQTTLPSGIWAFAAAGLPVIINRTMTAAIEMLPDDMTIPISASEMPYLKERVAQIDWKAVDEAELDHVDMKHTITNLANFLEQNEIF